MVDIWKAWDLMNRKDPEFLEVKNKQFIFPYLVRLAGRLKHISYIRDINRDLFKVKKQEILLDEIFFSLSPDPYCGKIKGTKVNSDILEVLKPYIQRLYGWSSKEFNFQLPLILEFIKDNNYIQELNRLYSFEKKECKVLGLEFSNYKPKPQEIKKAESASLFDF